MSFSQQPSPRTGPSAISPTMTCRSRLSPYLHWGHVSRPRDLRCGRDARRLARCAARQSHRRARGLVGPQRVGRELSRPADRLARARLQHGVEARRLRPVRVAAVMGAQHAEEAPERRPRSALLTRDRSRRHGPTIRCGTRHSGNCGARAGSTTTCACSGARRSWSGRRRRARRCGS